MIHLKNKFEVEKMYVAGQIVKETLFLIEENIKEGITTLELDRMAEEYILSKGAIPGFKGLYGFPATLCVSIEDEVVHGIPSDRRLKSGEIVGIDVGSIYNDFYGDHAKTFEVGEVSTNVSKLLSCCHESLMLGIKEAFPGNKLHDISSAIQVSAEKNGYSVVRNFVGHGVGTQLHEEPQVPNFGMPGTGPELRVGMVLAIEPMLNQGTESVKVLEDKWTVVTEDLKLSAHFEHSIAITDEGPDILSITDA